MSNNTTGRLRTGAAVAAVVLAVVSRGDALTIAAMLGVAAWRPSALSVVPALIASSWRWGSSSLEALAGAQGVLGPAMFVGPISAAAGTWLAGAAILLAIPDASTAGRARSALVTMAAGAASAAVVAGPGGEGLWVRGVVIVLACVAAGGVARLRARRPSTARALDLGAALAGAGALVAVSLRAPRWPGTVDAEALGEGVVVALAAVALVSVGAWGLATLGHRQA